MKTPRSLVTHFAFFLVLLSPVALRSATPDPAFAKGKRVALVCNLTDFEKAKAVMPAIPARIESTQTQRNNDEKLAAYRGTLGFAVATADEYSSAALADDQDLFVISESVSAVEIGTKYRSPAVPLVTFLYATPSSSSAPQALRSRAPRLCGPRRSRSEKRLHNV